MVILYDADTDTFQSRTRRYARDRGRPMLVVPDWERIDDAYMPDWMVADIVAANEDCFACDARWNDAYTALRTSELDRVLFPLHTHEERRA